MGVVLVADDEEPVRMLLRRLLQRGGYEVIEARDGVEALEQIGFLGLELDLLVLDLMMPRVNGFEVIRALETITSPVLRRTVVVTAFTQEVHGQLPTLVHSVVTKPFDVNRFMMTIRLCLRDNEAQ